MYLSIIRLKTTERTSVLFFLCLKFCAYKLPRSLIVLKEPENQGPVSLAIIGFLIQLNHQEQGLKLQ
jgi:hypothetical protein